MSTSTLRAFRETVGEDEGLRAQVIALITDSADLTGVAALASAQGFAVSEDELEDYLIDPGDELLPWEEEMAGEAVHGGFPSKTGFRRRRYEMYASRAVECKPTRSDARLKAAIRPAGQSPLGIPRYTFAYTADPSGTRYHGAMAQDLLQTHPEAVVVGDDGYYRVRYAAIDVDFFAV